MRSLNRIGTQPMSLPLSADDIVEFHAARLMLLMYICGTKGQIDGLTKMAKLDFFVRYPEFFEVARLAVTPAEPNITSSEHHSDERVESAMVRHHYGPWDKRYYHVLAYLEGKGLIAVNKDGKAYCIALTELGRTCAVDLTARASFAPLIERMREVKKTFGNKKGSFLKDLIYQLFDKEVGQRPMGERIKK